MDKGIQERGVIQRLASLRATVIEMVVVAVFLGFGVGLVASSLCALLKDIEVYGVIIGISISVASLSYFFFKVLTPKPSTFTCRGFLYLVQTDRSVEVRPAYRYELSERVSEYLRSAFAENPALLRAWLSAPLRWLPGESATTTALSANALLNQAIEYFFLNRLSLHLSAYFNEEDVEEAECQKFNRTDIPDVLLQNRFLELFSKPMEERDHFSDPDRTGGVEAVSLGKAASLGEVVTAWGRDGAMFDMFELILPKGSRVSRSANGVLRLETAVFSLEFRPGMEGFATNVPWDFPSLYMREQELRYRPPILVNSKMTITVKRRALFLRSGWGYYGWLDSFIDMYYDEAEAGRFFEAIGWETAVTMNRIESADPVSSRREAEPRSAADGDRPAAE
jgi:hypothetical protein